MLELFAIYGLAWIIRESDLLAGVRRWLVQRSALLTQLIMCWYCLGFWSGVFVYLLHSGTANAFETFSPFEWVVWGFAGSAASAFGNAVMQKLDWQVIDTNKETQ